MEKESLRNGIASMTMIFTMIWDLLRRVQSISVLFLVALRSTLILVGEEQAAKKKVIIWLRISIMSSMEIRFFYCLIVFLSFLSFLKLFDDLVILSRSQHREQAATSEELKHICSER